MTSHSALLRASALAILIMSFIALPGSAQETAGAGEREITRTVGDGVFTLAQAVRGDSLAQAHCGACHSKDEWLSSSFLDGWTGIPVSFLFENISATMPPAPARQLTPRQYVDIIAYILQINGAPAGEVELPSNSDELESILMSG